jgi:septal ring factor EnvC (AmiA/AmiB activator)
MADDETPGMTITPEAQLTLAAQQAIRSYMLRLVAIPGGVLAVVMFLLGFFVNDAAKSNAYAVAYKDSTDRMMVLVQNAQDARQEIKVAHDEGAKLLVDIRANHEESTKVRDALASLKALTESESSLEKLAKAIADRKEFAQQVLGIRDSLRASEQESKERDKKLAKWLLFVFDQAEANDTTAENWQFVLRANRASIAAELPR